MNTSRTMVSSLWQKSWEDAQRQLCMPVDSQELSSDPRRQQLRVGQLDADLLDAELAQVLQEPLVKSLSAILPAFQATCGPEMTLLIRLCLYKLSVWDLGATYGAKLQDLRYLCENAATKGLSPSGLPKKTLIAHVILTIFVPYFHSRIRSHALSNSWPDLPFVDRRRKAWNLLNKFELLHSAAALLNFAVFLWSGRYPTLSDRLTRMYLFPARRLTNRQVSYEFMNRQMVWHAFTEFILLIFPLLSSRAIRKTYYKIASIVMNLRWTSVMSSPRHKGRRKVSALVSSGPFSKLHEDQCAICAENASFDIVSSSISREATLGTPFNATASTTFRPDILEERPDVQHPMMNSIDSAEGPPKYPITTPYVASCGHIYCYFCITERLIRAVDEGDDGWECLRCFQRIRSCERAYPPDDSESLHMSDSWTSDGDDIISFSSNS